MKAQKNKDSNPRMAAHYARVAPSYNQAFFYQNSSDYHSLQLKHVLYHLRLKPTDQVVDLGCGTGVFSSALYTRASLTQNILAVDPSQPMLDQAQALPGLITYCADALTFIQDPTIRCDKVLMKEVIHHIPSADLPQLYRGIYRQLHKGGILLTVRRPTIAPQMFFRAALELLSGAILATKKSIKNMEDAGFSVSYQIHRYPVQMPKKLWFSMLRERMWSNFSNFSDDELEAGLAELEAKHKQTDVLDFDDKLWFIEAIKD